jgi:hypothetical protein
MLLIIRVMAVGAVWSEPLSSPNFPVNREKYRDFFEFWLRRANGEFLYHSGCKMIPASCGNQARTEQGFFLMYQGIAFPCSGMRSSNHISKPWDQMRFHELAGGRLRFRLDPDRRSNTGRICPGSSALIYLLLDDFRSIIPAPWKLLHS